MFMLLGNPMETNNLFSKGILAKRQPNLKVIDAKDDYDNIIMIVKTLCIWSTFGSKICFGCTLLWGGVGGWGTDGLCLLRIVVFKRI